MTLIKYIIYIIIFFNLQINVRCTNASESSEKLAEPRVINGYECRNIQLINTKFAIALVTDNGILGCGGSLISPYWVLTAAHCIPNGRNLHATDAATKDKYTNKLGVISMSRVHQVRSYHAYPGKGYEHDIAMLHLKTPIHKSNEVGFVKLPPPINGDVSDRCSAGLGMGWGLTDQNNKKLATRLMCVNLKILPFKECQKYYPLRIAEMCTEPSTEKGLCTGDSGGPLVCGGVQYGVLAYQGAKCANGFPSYYARVDKYLHFIKTTMKNEGMQILSFNFLYYFVIVYSSLLLSFP